MSKVRKWDGEETFAGSRGNGEVAPTPAVRQTTASRLKSTLSGIRPLPKRSAACRDP